MGNLKLGWTKYWEIMFTRGTMQQQPLRNGPDNSSGSSLTTSVKSVIIGLSESLSHLPCFCACCAEECKSLQFYITCAKLLVLYCSGEGYF